MPKEIVKYACLICGKVYEDEDEREAYEKALECEKTPVEEPVCKVGDAVIINDEPVIIGEISPKEVSHKLQYYYFDGHRNYFVFKNSIRLNK